MQSPLVRLPFPQEDGSLTPYTFELGYPLVTLLYDTLLWRDADGVPRPWLAQSVDTSADGRSVTVHLADGVRWQDGVPLTAADVAFTFAYVAANPHPRFTPELEAVVRADAIDASTVVIALAHPSPGFADQPMADLPILPAHLWQDLPAGQVAPDGLPIGSGPYRLVDHQPGRSYRFEAYADHFRGRPAVTTIEVPINNDLGDILVRYSSGVLDMVPFSLPKDTAEALDQAGTDVARGPSYSGTVVTFNLRQPPFDNAELRQALAKAIDIRHLVTVNGDAVAADHGFLHPNSPWASTEILGGLDEIGARAVVARLKPPPIEVLTPDNDPTKMEAAHQVALAWSSVGVTVQAKQVPRGEFAEALGDDGSNPTFQAAITTTPALASSDPDFLRQLFGAGENSGGLNRSGYKTAAFDAVAERVASTPDPAERRVIVDEELRLLATDVPAVPLFFATGAYAYRPAAFDGWVFVKGTGILDKRSFVEPRRAAESGVPTAVSPQIVHTGGLSPVFIVFGLAGLFIGVAVIILVVRRRRSAGGG